MASQGAKINVQTTSCDRREPANASSLYLAVTPSPGKRPSPAPLFDDVFSFHFGFSVAAENLRWVRNISRTRPGVNGGRFISTPGNVVAVRARRIAVSIAWTTGHSRAGSKCSLARKPRASLRNIRQNCVERNAAKSRKKDCESAAG